MVRELNDALVEGKRTLTTEKDKMYEIYIQDGIRGETVMLDDDTIFDYWYDHCIHPKHFKDLAKKHNCEYTLETFHKITNEYNVNYLGTASLLENSIDGKRIEVSLYSEDDRIYLEDTDGKEIAFNSLTELNQWLVEHELKPYPTFGVPDDKLNTWVIPNGSLFDNKPYKVLCKHDKENNEFIVITIHNLNGLCVTVDFQKYWSDLELLDTMDMLYRAYGIEVDDVFNLTSLYVNEASINSRDYLLQLGKKTVSNGTYSEYESVEQILSEIKKEHGLDITEAVEEVLSKK